MSASSLPDTVADADLQLLTTLETSPALRDFAEYGWQSRNLHGRRPLPAPAVTPR